MEPVANQEKNLCRVCIKNEGTVPLFQDDGHLRVVAVQIMIIASVKVSLKDGLPSHVCSECANQVQTFFSFKVQCEASDATLRAMMAIDPVSKQVTVVNKNNQAAPVNSELNNTCYKLDDTHNRLTTLVTSLEDLQQTYDDGDSTSPTLARRARKRIKKTSSLGSSPSCEVVDITDDEDNAKSVAEVDKLDLDFKGFDMNTCSPGYRKVRGMDPQPSGSRAAGPSTDSLCFVVEMNSESEWAVNCGSVDPLQTRDAE